MGTNVPTANYVFTKLPKNQYKIQNKKYTKEKLTIRIEVLGIDNVLPLDVAYTLKGGF